MDDLIEKAESSPGSVDLAEIPGGYGCSTPGIDRMVDIAISVDGVLGAQIAGAGLGGCMMALLRSDSLESLTSALTTQYYEPRNLDTAVFACNPSAGSGILRR